MRRIRWHLTGKPDAVYGLARGMLLSAIPATTQSTILHSEKFVLVDANGKRRGVYDSKDDEQIQMLSTDAKALVAETHTGGRHGDSVLPAVNCTLNATSAVLLTAAYICIKKRRIEAHATLIISALVTRRVSGLCYLIYHLNYPAKRHRPACGTVENGISDHAGLACCARRRHGADDSAGTAAGVPPELDSPSKNCLAPTLWIWLYISVTGVLIYWILYHLVPSLYPMAAK